MEEAKKYVIKDAEGREIGAASGDPAWIRHQLFLSHGEDVEDFTIEEERDTRH